MGAGGFAAAVLSRVCPKGLDEGAAPAAGAAAALRGRADRPDYRPLLAQLDIPAFVCAGSADPWSDQAVTTEITACLKCPELAVIEGAGHLPNLEAESSFNQALLGFLRAHTPSPHR